MACFFHQVRSQRSFGPALPYISHVIIKAVQNLHEYSYAAQQKYADYQGTVLPALQGFQQRIIQPRRNKRIIGAGMLRGWVSVSEAQN